MVTRILRFCFSVSFLLGAVLGCSRTDLAFKFADTYIAAKTDEYFSLTSAQKKEFTKNLQGDLEQIRQKTFPVLAQKFRDLEKYTFQDKISEAQLETIFKLVQEQFHAVGQQFSDSTLKLVVQLNDSQYEYLEKQVHKNIKSNDEDSQDPRDLVKETNKKYKKMFVLWLGDLSSDQKKMLEKFIKEKPFPWQLRNKNKEFIMKNFLEARKKPETLKAFIQAFFTQYDSLQLPAYKTAALKYEADLRVFMVSLWKTFSPAQREYLHEALEKRAQDLDRLAKERP